MSTGERRPLAEAQIIAEDLLALLAPYAAWCAIAGSIRRQRPTIGDGEIVAIPIGGHITKAHSLLGITDKLLHEGVISQALYNGKPRWGTKLRGIIYKGMKFELFMVDEYNRGYRFAVCTGPDNSEDKANTYCMTMIKRGKAPFSVHDGYVWLGDTALKINTEEDWFALLGIPCLPPPERSIKAYMRFFGRGHRWGDPQRYRVQYVQQTLWNLEHMLELEERHLKADASPSLPQRDFQWCAPWLRGNGMVIIRDWRGRWVLAEPTHPAAEGYRQRLCWMSSPLFGGEQYTLTAWLRDQWERQHFVADVLAEAIEALRDAVYE